MSGPVYDLDIAFPGTAPSDDETQQRGWIARIDLVDRIPAGVTERQRIGAICLSTAEATDETAYSERDGWGVDRDSVVEPVISERESRTAVDGRIHSGRLFRDQIPPEPAATERRAAAEIADFAAVEKLVDIDGLRRLDTALPLVGLPAARELRPRGNLAVTTVAVIDRQFMKAELVEDPRMSAVRVVRLEESLGHNVPDAIGHGTAMSIALLVSCDANIAPYQAGFNPRGNYDDIGGTHLAIAIAQACAEGADVIQIAINRSVVGSPRHLRRVMHEVARTGRRGRGTIIVWSTGDPTQTNDDDQRFTALPADDPTAQPWVLVVGPCEENGAWARSADEQSTKGRLGPSVELTAPGLHLSVVHGPVSGQVDDSSLSSALVAAVASVVLARNPWLSASELRELLCLTARRPATPDVATSGAGSSGGNDWDRTGHNLKVGHGTVDAQRATLAALDPVCTAFILAGRPASPDTSEPGLVLARRWHDHLLALDADMIVEYQIRWAQLLVGAVLGSRDVRRAVLWCARHLVELSLAPSTTWSQSSHHALVQRALVALWEGVAYLERAGDAGEVSSEMSQAAYFATRVEHAILAANGEISAFLARLVGSSES